MYFICELVMIIILLSSRVVQAILSKCRTELCGFVCCICFDRGSCGKGDMSNPLKRWHRTT